LIDKLFLIFIFILTIYSINLENYEKNQVLRTTFKNLTFKEFIKVFKICRQFLDKEKILKELADFFIKEK